MAVFPLPPPLAYKHEILCTPNYDTLLTMFKGPSDILREMQVNTCLECNNLSFSFSLWLYQNRIIHICRLCTNSYARKPEMAVALYPDNNTYASKYQYALSLYKFHKVYEAELAPAYLIALEEAQMVFAAQIRKVNCR